jgi:protoporphyrin/coproporphyrin ferrochelatase
MAAVTPQPGVVLLNMGGPDTSADIEPFLHRVLADPMLIRLPAGFLWQWLFARLVSKRRARKVATRYEQIGGGSPLLAETRHLASALAKRLDMPVSIGMRYSNPGAATAIEQLEQRGVNTIVALPLYPQYSGSTTASSLADLKHHLPSAMQMTVISRHGQAPKFLQTLASQINQALQDSTPETALLFTAHSIPVAYSRNGDPYIHEVERTVEGIVPLLTHPVAWRLGYQSSTRFGTWHGPDLNEVLSELKAKGFTNLVVQPVTFASENLETRFDLDIVLKNNALAMGFTAPIRLPAPGRNQLYIETLSELVRDHLTTKVNTQ